MTAIPISPLKHAIKFPTEKFALALGLTRRAGCIFQEALGVLLSLASAKQIQQHESAGRRHPQEMMNARFRKDASRTAPWPTVLRDGLFGKIGIALLLLRQILDLDGAERCSRCRDIHR